MTNWSLKTMMGMTIARNLTYDLAVAEAIQKSSECVGLFYIISRSSRLIYWYQNGRFHKQMGM